MSQQPQATKRMSRDEFRRLLHLFGSKCSMMGYSKSGNETENHRRAAEEKANAILAEFDALTADAAAKTPQWTDTPPTVEGTYYWRQDELSDYRIREVWPDETDDGQWVLRGDEVEIFADGGDLYELSGSIHDGQWLGPITPESFAAWSDAAALRMRIEELEGGKKS